MLGCSWFAVFAQQSRIADLGRNFRGAEARLTSGDLLIFAGIVVGAAALVLVLKRLAQGGPKRRCNSPSKLFRELCRLHGLDHGNRALLTRLAKQQQLDHPGRLFVESERFDLNKLGPLSAEADRVSTLRLRLFAPGFASLVVEEEQTVRS